MGSFSTKKSTESTTAFITTALVGYKDQLNVDAVNQSSGVDIH
jgi:hypothetical protein